VTEAQAGSAERAPVVALLAANAISQVGNTMTALALPWYVLETTGNAAAVGVAGAAVTFGGTITSVLGGPLVDRIGFRRASVVGDIACSLTIAAVPVLHFAGLLSFPLLVLLVFLMSCINTQGDTARFAMVPSLANRAALTMERANAAERAINRLGQIAGPVTAGVLIAVFGAINVLWVNAATYLVSALLIGLAVRHVGADSTRREAQGGGGYLAELREGVQFVRGQRVLLAMILLVAFGNVLDAPLISVIMPVYAASLFESSTALGVMVGALGAGALLGTLLFALSGRRLPRRRTFLTCFVLAPLIGYATLVATPPLFVAVAGIAIAGLVSGPINPLLLTVVQERTPPHLAGRVFGTLSALAGMGVPVGLVVVGLVVEQLGVVTTIAVMGVLYLIATLGMNFNRSLHDMDARPPVTTSRTGSA
jgi:MFS family permease